MPEDCQCSIQQVGQNCEMICTDPDPGGGPTPGTGNPPHDINNNTTDPSLRKAIDELLQVKGIEGTIADIISKLQENTKVDVSVTQGQTVHGKIAETHSPKAIENRNPDHIVYETIFKVEIRIDEVLSKTASIEGLAAAMIHEVLHAYMNYNNIDYNMEFAQHTAISEKYIQTMSSFLTSKYGLPSIDANALAWHGVEETKLFKETESFNIEGQEVTLADLQAIAAQYYGGIGDKPGSGRPIY